MDFRLYYHILVFAVAFVIIFLGTYKFGKYLFSKDEFRSYLTRAEVAYWYRLQCKNIGFNYPLIGNFLFAVLEENNALLKLPLKETSDCLLPSKTFYFFRKNLVLYNYELVVGNQEDWDSERLKDLRELANTCIANYLQLYGLNGGISAYLHNGAWLASVFITRIVFHNHRLAFEVLYIDCPGAASYYQNLMACEKALANSVPEDFFDDEI